MTDIISTKEDLRKRFEELQENGFYPWGSGSNPKEPKAPYGREWQKHGHAKPTLDEIDDLFHHDILHIGMILPSRETSAGGVKINVLDCECEQVANEVRGLLQKHCPSALDKIAIHENEISGGVHYYLQLPLEDSLPKLVLKDARIKLKKHEGKGDSKTSPTVFETLGAECAKYCITHGPGRRQISERSLIRIETLTPEDVASVKTALDELRTLHPTPQSGERVARPAPSFKRRVSSNSSIDRFNAEAVVGEMLEEAGWRFDSETDEHWNFTRPSKESGVSASVRKDNQILHVFTSSTDFEEGTSYSPFQVYALLKHGIEKGGDYSQALRSLSKQNLGDEGNQDEKPRLVLPGKGSGIEECAEILFPPFGEAEELFYRDGGVCEIEPCDDGYRISSLVPARLTALMERRFQPVSKESLKDGTEYCKPACCGKTTAEQLLSTDAARNLPKITGLSSMPILASDGRVLQAGYDPTTGRFVTNNMSVRIPPLDKAIENVDLVLQDFLFASPGDRSRGIAALLTPAMVLGGILTKPTVQLAEAEDSQSGKGYLVKTGAAIYGEQIQYVAQRNGGVGSFDESLSACLYAGNPFICLDNFTGYFRSAFLEMVLTAEGNIPCRVPYRGEVQVDSRKFCFFLTSNGIDTSRDMANRMSIIRIRKQPPDYQFRKFGNGDLLDFIKANRPLMLGSVFAIAQEWIKQGKPRTDERRHDFREWTQSLDWIIQNIMGEVPLMDGLVEARTRISTPSMAFLRELAVLVSNDNKLDRGLTASNLYEMCEMRGLPIPGLKSESEDAGRIQIGRLMAQCFADGKEVVVDEYHVTLKEETVIRYDGRGNRPRKLYSFTKDGSVAE